MVKFGEIRNLNNFNPRLTGGGGYDGGYNPPGIFSRCRKTTDPVHLGNLFYILCAQFDEKNRVLYRWGVGCNPFQFLEI